MPSEANVRLPRVVANTVNPQDYVQNLKANDLPSLYGIKRNGKEKKEHDVATNRENDGCRGKMSRHGG